MNSFYMTLRAGETILPRRIFLERENWVVGLTEVLYSNTIPLAYWRDRHHANWVGTIRIQAGGRQTTIRVPRPDFSFNPHVVANLVQKTVGERFGDNVQFAFNERNNCFELHLSKWGDIRVKLDGEIADLMGFPEGEWLLCGCQMVRGASLIGNYHLRYIRVFLDIIKPRVVGREKLKILRGLPLRRDAGGFTGDIATRFKRIHYIFLDTAVFDRINLYITDLAGRPVNIDADSIQYTVHFKRIDLPDDEVLY